MKEPKIRLKGFTGEWNETTIGEIAAFSKGRGYSKSDLKTQGNPIILYGRLYTNYASTIKEVDTFATLQKGSVLSKGNEVIIPASGETPEDIAIASYVQQQGVILGGDLNVLTFDSTKINPAFAAIGISNSKTHTELSGYAQGKSVVHLHNGNIAKGHLTYPSVEEQESIISYINSLDSLIQSTTKKIESLKQVKAASLQSMFPQEGETTPRVRFKGFVGEWEKVKLDSICDFLKGKGLSKEKLIVSGKYKCVLYGEIFTKYDFEIKTPLSSTDHYEGALSKSGDIIMPGSTTTFGIDLAKAVHVPYNDVLYGGDIIILRPKNNRDFDSFFLATQISCVNREQVATVAQGITIVHLHASSVAELYYNFPSLEEQQAIASYFKNLDSQIALLAQQLEQLQQIKSACLDNMFV